MYYKEPYINSETYITTYFSNINDFTPSCTPTNYKEQTCIDSQFKKNNINNIRKIINDDNFKIKQNGNSILNISNLF
jgi:hypothetical protein